MSRSFSFLLIVTLLFLDENEGFSEQIKETLGQYVFYPGRSGDAGGRYIIGRYAVSECRI